jgi:flavin-dependent dehydrogenase
MRVALLDACHFPREKLCGEFLSAECWHVLRKLGLEDALQSSDYEPIRRIRLTTPRGSEIDTAICEPDQLPGLGLSRATLDAMLVRHAAKEGVDVYEGMRAGSPIVRDGRVAGVEMRHASEGQFEVHATAVVAANGRHSGLVQRTGVTRARGGWRPRLFGMKRHLLAEQDGASHSAGTVELHLLPGGYGGTCRIEGSLTNICALVPERVLRQNGGRLERVAERYLAQSPELRRHLDRGTPVGEWKTVSRVQIEISTPRIPGILYAGDCQGTVDPLGGQGMTMALLCGETLVPFLKEGLRRGIVDFSLQRAYERAWRKRFKRRIALCRAFHHVLVNPSLIDATSSLGSLPQRVLAACYAQTRDASLHEALN